MSSQRRIGTIARIAYDSDAGDPEPGDLLRSSGGSWYRIERVRPSPSIAGRFYLECVRLGRDLEPGEGTPVWGIHWYRRERGQRGRAA